MKLTYFLLAGLMLAAFSVRAQNQALNQFIDTHKTDPGFTFAYLSRDLFEVVSRSNVQEKDWKKVHKLVKNIGSLRVLAGDEIQTGLALYKEVLSLVPADEFDELLTVRADRTNVRIWSKDDGSIVTDLVLLVGSPEEFVLICFAGELELGNIAELARLFDAHEAADLTMATKAVEIDFQISPNPNIGVFTLSYAGEGDAPALMSVTDQSGRQVATLELSGAPTRQVTLRDLSAGIYWVQLKTAQGRVGVKQLQIVDRP